MCDGLSCIPILDNQNQWYIASEHGVSLTSLGRGLNPVWLFSSSAFIEPSNLAPLATSSGLGFHKLITCWMKNLVLLTRSQLLRMSLLLWERKEKSVSLHTLILLPFTILVLSFTVSKMGLMVMSPNHSGERVGGGMAMKALNLCTMDR